MHDSHSPEALAYCVDWVLRQRFDVDRLLTRTAHSSPSPEATRVWAKVPEHAVFSVHDPTNQFISVAYHIVDHLKGCALTGMFDWREIPGAEWGAGPVGVYHDPNDRSFVAVVMFCEARVRDFDAVETVQKQASADQLGEIGSSAPRAIEK